MMARLFAFMMLDAAQSSGKGSFSNGVRVMQVALKTAKTCLGTMRYASSMFFMPICYQLTDSRAQTPGLRA